MRDLNLGPDSKKLIERFNAIDPEPGALDKADLVILAREMSRMLERWNNIGWCWPDACPAQVCGGPHVKVVYATDSTVEVIEPYNKIGETFPDVPHTVVR